MDFFCLRLVQKYCQKLNTISINMEYFGKWNGKLLIISSKNYIIHTSELVTLFSGIKMKTNSYLNANFQMQDISRTN